MTQISDLLSVNFVTWEQNGHFPSRFLACLKISLSASSCSVFERNIKGLKIFGFCLNFLFYHSISSISQIKLIKIQKTESSSKNVNLITNNSTSSTDNTIPISIYQNNFEAIKDIGIDANIISEYLIIDRGFKSYNIPKVKLKNIMGNTTETEKAADLTVTIDKKLLHLTF
jgi:hypothetical protein